MIPAKKSALIERWFFSYARRYVRRSFHAIHLLGEPPRFAAETPALPWLVCLNHSSWWDVLLGFCIGKELFGGDHYGVMDERQLRRYAFFARLGAIGVDRTSLTGAKEFLRYCETLFRGQPRALWITPQGEFASNYARPVRFQSGIGYLAERLGEFHLTTLAFHYEFWEERLPEAFVSFSPLTRVRVGADFDRKAFVQAQERLMESQLDALLACVQARDASIFRPYLRGSTGISPTYDLMRRLTARLKGERFTAEHGAIVTPQWKEASRK